MGFAGMEQRNQSEVEQGTEGLRALRMRRLRAQRCPCGEKDRSPDETGGRQPHLSPSSSEKGHFIKFLALCLSGQARGGPRPPDKMQSVQQSRWQVCLCMAPGSSSGQGSFPPTSPFPCQRAQIPSPPLCLPHFPEELQVCNPGGLWLRAGWPSWPLLAGTL